MCSRLLAPANCVVIILVAVWFVNTFLCNICKKYDCFFWAKGQHAVDFGAHWWYNEYADELKFDKGGFPHEKEIAVLNTPDCYTDFGSIALWCGM
jgi:hypothetical protein